MARKTFTSTAVKTRWNRRHYDRLTLLLPKGYKEVIKKYTEEQGLSINGFVNETARELVGVSAEDWKPLYVDP